jgi:hypothetical protein
MATANRINILIKGTAIGAFYIATLTNENYQIIVEVFTKLSNERIMLAEGTTIWKKHRTKAREKRV